MRTSVDGNASFSRHTGVERTGILPPRVAYLRNGRSVNGGGDSALLPEWRIQWTGQM